MFLEFGVENCPVKIEVRVENCLYWDVISHANWQLLEHWTYLTTTYINIYLKVMQPAIAKLNFRSALELNSFIFLGNIVICGTLNMNPAAGGNDTLPCEVWDLLSVCVRTQIALTSTNFSAPLPYTDMEALILTFKNKFDKNTMWVCDCQVWFRPTHSNNISEVNNNGHKVDTKLPYSSIIVASQFKPMVSTRLRA